MLDFLTNVFQEKSSIKNTCGPWMENIQGCVGCDGECKYTCFSMCSELCHENSEDSGGSGGGTCNSNCTGTCFSFVSIIEGK